MPELSLEDLVVPQMADLAAYTPEQGRYAVRLDANEAPALLRPEARARLAEEVAGTAWERYPDATARELREAIAAHAGVSADEVLVGVGSDEVIALLLTVLARPRGRAREGLLVTTTPTFVMYRQSAKVRGLRVMEVPLDDAWNLAVDSMLQAIDIGAPNIVFIASPNNPTGTTASSADLERVIEAAAGALVVIDEAYVDYARGDHLELYRRHDNVAILRTLSKIGFAALRLGWLLAHPELVRELDKARLPYNISTPSQQLGRVVLSELGGEIELVRRTVIDERERVASELGRMPRVDVTPSEANFLWLRTERPAGEVFADLAERGVLVRSFHRRGGRLAHQLRVTIGRRDQNDAFLSALGEVA
jgi:histidinol-phosphate aminotransferase